MMTLLKVRSIQIKRELNDVGLRVLLIIGFLFFLIYASFSIYQKTPDAFYLTTLLFLFCLFLHMNRKDKSFVYNHIDKPHLEIYSEYFALTFLFAVPVLFSTNWYCYPILLSSLLMLPFLKYTFQQETYFRNISSLIPASNFELISGFRKSFLSLILFYFLAIVFSWFIILPLFLLWYITIMIVSFYDECEPLQILKEGSISSKKFIFQKLYHHSKILILLYSPVLIVNTIFNFEYWLINLLFLFTQLSLLCFSICFKYSNYQPNKIYYGSKIIVSLVSAGSVIPYLLPIPLLMAIIHYGKAKNNLDNYLDD